MKYNFFDYLTVNIDTNGHRGYESYFDNEYRRIVGRSKARSNVPSITLKIVDVMPNAKDDDIQRKVHFKKLFTYHYMIRGINNKDTEIYFKSHWVDKVYMNAIGVFAQTQLLEPIMYLKLLKQNVLFMHAGGVADSNNGYLLPAHGGTGKTTFSIALLNNGYKLLGDDLLFVSLSEGKVYPYPRPMHIFTYNINNLNGAKIPLKYKLIVYGKNIIRFLLEKLLRTELMISTRIHADEVFAGQPFGKTVPYSKILFLVKAGPTTTTLDLTSENIKTVADEIMKSADLNDSLYEIIRGSANIDKIEQLEQNVITKLLRQFPEITYVNTRKLDLKNLQPFISEYLK